MGKFNMLAMFLLGFLVIIQIYAQPEKEVKDDKQVISVKKEEVDDEMKNEELMDVDDTMYDEDVDQDIMEQALKEREDAIWRWLSRRRKPFRWTPYYVTRRRKPQSARRRVVKTRF